MNTAYHSKRKVMVVMKSNDQKTSFKLKIYKYLYL